MTRVNLLYSGPKIILTDGTYYSSPMRKSTITSKELKLKKLYFKLLLTLNLIGVEELLIMLKKNAKKI